jgi:hypothetical protein
MTYRRRRILAYGLTLGHTQGLKQIDTGPNFHQKWPTAPADVSLYPRAFHPVGPKVSTQSG